MIETPWALKAASLGTDGTVGGPSGSPLSPSVALVSSPNVFTADADTHTPISIEPHSATQTGSLLLVGNGAGNWYSPAATVDEYQSMTSATDIRQVMHHVRADANPSALPSVAVDYHGIDLLVNSSSVNVNNEVGFYPLESNAQYTGAGTVGRLVSLYGFATAGASGVATNVATDMSGLQIWTRNLGSGTVALSRGVYVETPDNPGGGTITEHRSLHIANPIVAGITTAYAIKVDGGQSYHNGRFTFGAFASPTRAAAISASVLVQAQNTGSVETALRVETISGGQQGDLFQCTDMNGNVGVRVYAGATGVNIDPPGASALKTGAGLAVRVGAGNVPVYVRQSASPTVPALQIQNSTPADIFSILQSGQIKTSSGNEATGAGSAALGANSPAVTNTAPYTWLKFTSSDGSQVYVPAWK